MEQPSLCPQCHQPIRQTDYFCSNCGKKLKEVPPSTSLSRQFVLYLGSIVLPPMGLVWGLRYVKQADQKSKLIGIIAMVLTVISLLVSTKLLVDYIQRVNEEVTKQLNGMQGF